MKRAAGIAWGAGAAGLLLLAWLICGGDPQAPAAVVGAAVPQSAATAEAGVSAAISNPDASAPVSVSVESVGEDIAASSLRGSSADGDWGVDAAGRFRPSRELRRRFDYYLALEGEVVLPALQRWIEAQIRERHGAAAAAQVMPVFAAYLRLQAYPWRATADPQHPQTLAPALAERQQVRRELLGIEVAEAFYRDDDAALQAMIAQANTGGAPLTAAPEQPAPEPLPDAPDRLAQWQAQWDDWERRLAEARTEITRVQAAPELSEPQRAAAIEAWLTQRFGQAEQQRARALLQVPPR